MRLPLSVLAIVCAVVAGCAKDDDDDGAAAPPSVSIDSPTATSTSAPGTTTVPAGTAPEQSDPAVPGASDLYANRANWICRPDVDDLCDADLDITDVAPDGTTTVREFEAATDPAVDCFYVYPTNSEDLTLNSDLVPGTELLTTRLQAARFSQVCDVYAPVYRSMTIAGLLNPMLGDGAKAFAVAYADVVDVWRYYLANDNDGRGVILIGHSQGTFHLNQLLREEIDPVAETRALLVGAYLLGGPVSVPVGADVGGDLQQIPLCRSFGQPGCIVTYATYRSTAPPPSDAMFGVPLVGEGMAGCVNPAAPGGGSGELESAFSSSNRALTDRSLTPATPFMNFPGFITGECKYADGISYLELTLHPDPSDVRADDLVGADLTPQWGTHLIDVAVASGTLIEFARGQIEAYSSAPARAAGGAASR